MQTFILSGFADEAGKSIERQMDVLEKNGLNMIEMRAVDGGPVIEKTADELRIIKEKMDKRGFSVSSIGSPVGKSPVLEDFEIAKATFHKAVNAALTLGTKYVRAFSFYLPKECDPMMYADEVIRRMKELVKIAEANGIIYSLENESGIFTDIPSRCLYVMENIESPGLKMAFDPGNFIFNSTKPYPDAYELLKKYIAYFHVKDATYDPRRFVPAGEGDSNMGSLLAAVYADGFNGVLSLEPHLQYIKDINDAQRFTVATNALKKTLNASLGADFAIVDTAEFSEYC